MTLFEIERALVNAELTHPYGLWGRGGAMPSLRQGLLESVAAMHPENMRRNFARVESRFNVSLDVYLGRVKRAAEHVEIPPAVILALASRESVHGLFLNDKGEGDNGFAFGVLQVDRRYHEQHGQADPLSLAHLIQGASIWKKYLGAIESKHPSWPDWAKVKGAFVAYNSGPGNVATIQRMDKGTTGNDYGADTGLRAREALLQWSAGGYLL